VYGSSEGLHVLLLEHNAPGGQAGTSSLIENYLGFPSGVSGADLAQRATVQARRFGTELVVGQAAVAVRREDPFRIVTLEDGQEVSCHALVLASGLAVRQLAVDGIDRLAGAGIYYGASTNDAAMYRGQDICIVGGANSAGQAALFFSRYARTVTIFVRAADLGAAMSQYLVDRIVATENIHVMTRVEPKAVCGGTHVERVVVRHTETGEEHGFDTTAVFIFIGVAPRTEKFSAFVFVDDKGFIVTGPDLRPLNQWKLDRDPFMFETSVPGVFAVGDVRAGSNRRIAAAVGEGSAAVFSVHQYLRTV
jgi:thioredoxin reductase (NADPH)